MKTVCMRIWLVLTLSISLQSFGEQNNVRDVFDSHRELMYQMGLTTAGAVKWENGWIVQPSLGGTRKYVGDLVIPGRGKRFYYYDPTKSRYFEGEIEQTDHNSKYAILQSEGARNGLQFQIGFYAGRVYWAKYDEYKTLDFSQKKGIQTIPGKAVSEVQMIEEMRRVISNEIDSFLPAVGLVKAITNAHRDHGDSPVINGRIRAIIESYSTRVKKMLELIEFAGKRHTWDMGVFDPKIKKHLETQLRIIKSMNEEFVSKREPPMSTNHRSLQIPNHTVK